MKTIE
jgi:hypothetical protein